MNTLQSVRKAPHAKTFGIEVECVARNIEDPYRSWYGFFFRGNDGSIQVNRPRNWDDKGCEFVSQPLGYEWMQREIKRLGKHLTNMNVYYNESCGIHVHVSKKWFTNKKAELVYDFLRSLCYADMRELFGREPNDYCMTRTAFRANHYLAVNTENTHTNELRMFASGNTQWQLYCVAMAKYLVENATHLNYDAIFAFRAMHDAQPG